MQANEKLLKLKKMKNTDKTFDEKRYYVVLLNKTKYVINDVDDFDLINRHRKHIVLATSSKKKAYKFCKQ